MNALGPCQWMCNLHETNAEDQVKQVLLALRDLKTPDNADGKKCRDDVADQVDGGVCIPNTVSYVIDESR